MIGVAVANGQATSRPNGSGGIWEYISPSRLNTWLSCPLKFKLRYIDKIRTPASPALFLGKQVHAGLEIYYRHRMLGVTLESAAVAKRMDDGWDAAAAEEGIAFANTADELAIKTQAVDLVTAYLAQVPEDEPAPQAVEVTLEQPLVDPFSGEHLGIPLLGVVDLIMPLEDSVSVVDFKTSSRSAPPFEIAHEIQLSSYAYLYRATTGDEEAGLEIRSLVKTKKPKIEQHEYAARSEAHLRRLFAVIHEYLDALDSGTFNFRPGWGCAMCEHRDVACKQWCE